MSDTKQARRYYLATGYCEAESCNAYLEERDDGEYVDAADYDKLEAEHRALLDESLRVEKALVDELAALKAKIKETAEMYEREITLIRASKGGTP